jgi:ABC-type polysaccharide/polyol phosphate export permease
MERGGKSFLRHYLTDLGVLLTSLVIASEFRHTLHVGQHLEVDYQWHDPWSYVITALSLALAHGVHVLMHLSITGRAAHRFRAPFVGILLAVAGQTLFLRNHSRLESIYFAIVALALISLVIARPAEIGGGDASRDPLGPLHQLWSHRDLLYLWIDDNIRSRYTQALLGAFWIALLPLSTAFIMSAVFSKIMRVPVGDAPFTAFLLAGLVPWGLFSQSISTGMRSLLAIRGLLNQIYFPREIAVLSALGEALVDTAFMFLAMLVVNAAFGVWPNARYIFLPPLLLIQLSLSLGLMLALSWLTMVIRDIPQLVSVVLQITFYASAILYPPRIVPQWFLPLIVLNPVAVLIEAYRGIIVYDRTPDWRQLVYPAAFGLAMLVFGYRLFKANEESFADLL